MENLVELNDFSQNASWNKVETSGMINIISNYNLAKVITSLYKVGILSKLRTMNPILVESFKEFDSYLLGHTFHYLKIHNVLTVSEKGYHLTSRGRDLLSEESIAQLCFYSESYDNITSNIDNFLTKKIQYGIDIERDGKSLGIHCDTLFKEYHSPTVLQAIKQFKGSKVLDIGCGGGQFLVDLCKQDSAITGIGLDISEPAISHANSNARKNNLENKINFFVADAFNLDSWTEECFGADILCGSGVIHEHFRNGEQAVIDILDTYSQLLKNNGFKAIILGEPEIRHDLIKSDSDLYLVHIYTAQGFPRYREEWINLFEKTNLTCSKVFSRLNAGPRFNFFVLTLK